MWLACLPLSQDKSLSRILKKEKRKKKEKKDFLNNLWGARNGVGKGLSNRPAGLHSLAELIHWKRIPGLHRRLKIRAPGRFLAEH
jgi:hypothetical protein